MPNEPEFIDPLPDEDEELDDYDYYDDHLDCGCCACCGCYCGNWDDLYSDDYDAFDYSQEELND